jgi:DNA-binding NarL/FixJ family response regulator
MILRRHTGVRRRFRAAGIARTTSILIVADSALYRDGLALSLARRAGIRLVGPAIGPEEMIERVTASAPDVVLFDVTDNGLGRLGELFAAEPRARVIVLGFRETESDVLAYARAGVSGFVTRESSLDELVACVRSVVHDDLVFSPRVAAALFARVGAQPADDVPVPAALTPRQREILELIEAGLSNKQIAQQLCIELSTVKNHVHQILDKLHVQTRRDAVSVLRKGAERLLGGLAMLAEQGFELPV